MRGKELAAWEQFKQLLQKQLIELILIMIRS
jgi:hypothetical protein